MAKKVEGYIKLQIPAGKATPAPPVGPALGQHGVLSQRHRRQQSLSRKPARSNPVPVYRTRTKLQRSRKSS